MKEKSETEENENLEQKKRFSAIDYLLVAGVFAAVIAGGTIFARDVNELSESAKMEKFALAALDAENLHLRSLGWNEFEELHPSGEFEARDPDPNTSLDGYSIQRVISPRGETQKEVRLTVTWSGPNELVENQRQSIAYFSKGGGYHPLITPDGPTNLSIF